RVAKRQAGIRPSTPSLYLTSGVACAGLLRIGHIEFRHRVIEVLAEGGPLILGDLEMFVGLKHGTARIVVGTSRAATDHLGHVVFEARCADPVMCFVNGRVCIQDWIVHNPINKVVNYGSNRIDATKTLIKRRLVSRGTHCRPPPFIKPETLVYLAQSPCAPPRTHVRHSYRPETGDGHSGLMFAARITLAHFSVSSAISLPKVGGRAPRERPRGCAAEKRDELAAPHHSITSSARASSVGGTSRPHTRRPTRLAPPVQPTPLGNSP